TSAHFSGGVRFIEAGSGTNRTAKSEALDVALKPAMGGFEDARFARGVRFEEGKLVGDAVVHCGKDSSRLRELVDCPASARYEPDKGTMQLSGSEAGVLVPHVVNEQVSVDAAKIDVVLEGPKVKAT